MANSNDRLVNINNIMHLSFNMHSILRRIKNELILEFILKSISEYS